MPTLIDPRLLPIERRRLADDLVARYHPLALSVAYKAGQRFPMLAEEFIDQALWTLWKAALRWSPDRNVRFATYAYPRVRFSVRDVLRKHGRVTHVEQLEQAAEQLILDHRSGPDEEAAERERPTLQSDRQDAQLLRRRRVPFRVVAAELGISSSRLAALVRNGRIPGPRGEKNHRWYAAAELPPIVRAVRALGQTGTG
jgi:RNA polymerase sigma factor (sigma-70 family)